nr:hypothetical protein [Tanacetum cinerariifolium]
MRDVCLNTHHLYPSGGLSAVLFIRGSVVRVAEPIIGVREGYIPSATSAADVATMCASGTQSADVALPHRLTWDPPTDVAAEVAWVYMLHGTT